MKLYLIAQNEKTPLNCDTGFYQAALVAALTEEHARYIHPSGFEWSVDDWCHTPHQVAVHEIGLAKDAQFTGVIMAQFCGRKEIR